MKKFLSIFLAIFLLFVFAFALSGCKKTEEKSALTVYAPDGAPALSIAKFIDSKENFGINAELSYNVVSADKIGGVMQQGTGDIIIMPVNASSKLYKANAENHYKMVSVVTHGNLYIVCNEEISITDLKGKKMGVIGQGLVPDLTLKAVLSKNGITVTTEDSVGEDQVGVKYYKEASELLPLLKKGQLEIGLLPEPACTNLKKIASDKTWFTLDLQNLYNAQTKSYPQAVMMIKESVLTKFPGLVDSIKEKFDDGVSWTKENVESAVNGISSVLTQGVTPSLTAKNINANVIDNCKIHWQDSLDAKESVKNYLSDIIAIGSELQNKPAVMVGDDYFYSK